jgi:hypothetical protein
MERWPNKIKRLDMLGQGLKFTMQGSEKYQTYFGAAITVVSYFIVLMYGAYQFQILILRGATN